MSPVNGKILQGDAVLMLQTLPDNSVQCCVTSPPYWGLRDYGMPGQIGLEPTPEEYVEKLVQVFREVRRVLRDDGTLWLNLGDSYLSTAAGSMGDALNRRGILSGVSERRAEGSRKYRPAIPSGLKPKDLVGIPWRVAFALQADGWYLRQDIIWNKPNPMPESVTDRCTKSHEYIFLLSKSARYYYDSEAVKEPCVSGPSDVNKMLNHEARIGGKTLTATDPRYAGVNTSNIRQKRAVGDPSGRNRRSVWNITTKPYRGAHYAVFPREIPELAIKAGTSFAGACSKCGAPLARVIEKTNEVRTDAKGSRFDAGKTGTRDGGDRTQKGERFYKRTIGWKPACECGERVVPCVVLDPFAGSGTTLAVARESGRNYVGIELNPEYIQAHITPRLEKIAPSLLTE